MKLIKFNYKKNINNTFLKYLKSNLLLKNF